MPKRRHHYVPKFYLRAFQSAPKRIHVYNLDRNTLIKDASLRDQCHAHRLYGDNNEVEDVLSVIESHTAPIIRTIIKVLKLPAAGTMEHFLLVLFIALQLTRTPLVAGRMGTMQSKFAEHLATEYPGMKVEGFDVAGLNSDNTTMESLANAAEIAYAINDLRMHLICAPEGRAFITSDNPAFKYNQYYEGLNGMGITGPLWRGIQIFLPLSPERLLLLYDNSVYKIGGKGSDAISTATSSDTETINLFQVVGAEHNLYFNGATIEGEIEHLSRVGSNHRSVDPTIVEAFEEVGNEENSSLIHLFERSPNLGVRLSFVRVRKRAQKIANTKWSRGRYRYRKTLPWDERDAARNVPREVRTEIYKRK